MNAATFAENAKRSFLGNHGTLPRKDRQREMLDRIAYPAKAAVGDATGVAFFNRMRDLVLSGFYTSEMGIRSLPYVGNEPQSEWHGCPPAVMAKLGV